MKPVVACFNHGNAVDLLRDEYSRIWKLCTVYQSALERDAAADRKSAARDLCRLVSICTLVEQEVLYPEVRKVDEELVFDLLLAYEEISACMVEMRSLEPEDMDYDVAMLRLIDLVQDHIRQSEQMLLPLVANEIPTVSLRPLAADLVQHRLLLETLALGKAAPRAVAVAGTPRLLHPSSAPVLEDIVEHRAAA